MIDKMHNCHYYIKNLINIVVIDTYEGDFYLRFSLYSSPFFLKMRQLNRVLNIIFIVKVLSKVYEN